MFSARNVPKRKQILLQFCLKIKSGSTEEGTKLLEYFFSVFPNKKDESDRFCRKRKRIKLIDLLLKGTEKEGTQIHTKIQIIDG